MRAGKRRRRPGFQLRYGGHQYGSLFFKIKPAAANFELTPIDF
jgi:hypothetical protein